MEYSVVKSLLLKKSSLPWR